MFPNQEDDYTLLIPTFNRPAGLGMLARYLARQSARFPIVILDGSDPDTQERNVAELSALPLTVTHRRFPPGLFETISAALAEVETPYCSLLPDDDILIPGGLTSALVFLRQHPDFSAAQGYNIDFLPYQGGIWLTDIPEWTPSIDQEEALTRLFHYSRRYQPACWAVYRTEVAARSYAAAVGFENLMSGELMHNYLAVRDGKLARLPVINRFRREDHSIVPRDQLHIFRQFLDSPEKLARNLVIFGERLVDAFLQSYDGALEREEVARVIDLIQGNFFDRHFDPARTEIEIRKTLGLMSPEAFAQEEVLLQSTEMMPPSADSVYDVSAIDGRVRRFWIGGGIHKALQNPEIQLSINDIKDAIADTAEYF